MDEVRNRAKYRTSHDLDFHHEKIALIRLAQMLKKDGWPEVRLSVPAGSLDQAELGGVDPGSLQGVDLSSEPIFDERFRSRFNTEDNFRYEFYYDKPGGIDLVARKGEELLLVEAKGRSRRDRVGGVYELIGRLVAAHNDDDGRTYGMLIPDNWRSALPASRPSLSWLRVYLIEANSGRIEETNLREITG